MCYAQSRTAKHLPPINLERGKIWPLFAVCFAIHARQRDFPPMQKYFPRIIGDRGKVSDTGQCLCLEGTVYRVFSVHLAVWYALPCAVRLLCRDSLVCREPWSTCTTKLPLPCSEKLMRTAQHGPHGKDRFSGSVQCARVRVLLCFLA